MIILAEVAVPEVVKVTAQALVLTTAVKDAHQVVILPALINVLNHAQVAVKMFAETTVPEDVKATVLQTVVLNVVAHVDPNVQQTVLIPVLQPVLAVVLIIALIHVQELVMDPVTQHVLA